MKTSSAIVVAASCLTLTQLVAALSAPAPTASLAAQSDSSLEPAGSAPAPINGAAAPINSAQAPQDRMAEFRAKFKIALDVNAKDEMTKLVRAYGDQAMSHALEL